MRIQMFLKAKDFAKEVGNLKVNFGWFTERDAETLTFTKLLFPRIRLRYPENIARRIYFENCDEEEIPVGLLEPNGTKWEIACELNNALHKYSNYLVYGSIPHPFTRTDGRYEEFVVQAGKLPFESKEASKIDVSSDRHLVLRDNSHLEFYYSTWQVLLAAEVMHSGLHLTLNWHSESITAEAIRDAMSEAKLPDVPTARSISFAHALKEFKKHEVVLDAATTLREKSDIEYMLLHKTKSGRFTPTPEEHQQQLSFEIQTAKECASDFLVGADSLVDAIRYLLERWLHWNHIDRPSVCIAYEKIISISVKFAMLSLDEKFSVIKQRIEPDGAHRNSILDKIWPDWLADNKVKTMLTLRGSLEKFPDVGESNLVRFAEFIEQNGLETFFWRLSSFEDHALRGNAFWISGMRADIQGLAIVVEHVARSVIHTMAGARFIVKDDTLDQFKHIFRGNSAIIRMLKDNAITRPARSAKGATSDWELMRQLLSDLRSRGAESAMVADLVIARYVRGAAHYTFPDVGHREMEDIFVALMRAAFFCFNETTKAKN